MPPYKSVKFLIEGGSATPGPPIAPALGPLGIRLDRVVAEINKKSMEFKGLKVPVEVIVDLETKDFEVKVGTPPTSALILKELGAERGSGEAKKKSIGSITMEQVLKIAKIKRPQSLSRTFKGTVLEVLGTCVSMGVLVDGKDPKEVIKAVKSGEFNGILREVE
uniref:Large ribosomal subunit protein uL11 n=1 Tax=uncultured korarchaeote TaxID=161241 RepID=A0A1L2JJW2_9CREN|nr:ribosomal protein L11 [uncultured korarchaeote]